MIELTRGFYGTKLLKPGTIISLDKASEERLVKRKVAVYVDNAQYSQDKEEKLPFEYTQEENEEYVFLEEEAIRKMSKDDLLMYGNSIGVPELLDSMRKVELLDAILNYIEENSDEVEEEI